MTDFAYQLHSSRGRPLAETLAMLAQLGYRRVEGTPALLEGGDDPAALRGSLDEHGLAMPTALVSIEGLGRAERLRAAAGALGVEAVFVSALPPEDRVRDAFGWRSLARDLSEMAAPLQEAGLIVGWHNMGYEFARIDAAETPLELILGTAENLALEFDAAWAALAEEEPLDWVARLGSRIVAAHLRDVAPAGQATEEAGWADLGHGEIDWPGLLTLLRATPCRHWVLAHDAPGDDRRFARLSLAAAERLLG